MGPSCDCKSGRPPISEKILQSRRIPSVLSSFFDATFVENVHVLLLLRSLEGESSSTSTLPSFFLSFPLLFLPLNNHHPGTKKKNNNNNSNSNNNNNIINNNNHNNNNNNINNIGLTHTGQQKTAIVESSLLSPEFSRVNPIIFGWQKPRNRPSIGISCTEFGTRNQLMHT